MIFFFSLGYFNLLESHRIRRLTKLAIFENFNQRYVNAYLEMDCERTRPPNPTLGRLLSDVCGNFETLSASFMVDAEIFFAFALDPARYFRLSKTWPNLRSLVLTSQLLAPDQDETPITNMLLAAAEAAVYMPKLETLQIWNGRRKLAALFKYEAATEGQPSTITWRGTWEFLFQPSVIQAWQSVASELPQDGMRVIYECIDVELVRCHGDAMVLLQLPEMVIRSVSLRQILNEQMCVPLQVSLPTRKIDSSICSTPIVADSKAKALDYGYLPTTGLS